MLIEDVIEDKKSKIDALQQECMLLSEMYPYVSAADGMFDFVKAYIFNKHKYLELYVHCSFDQICKILDEYDWRLKVNVEGPYGPPTSEEPFREARIDGCVIQLRKMR